MTARQRRTPYGARWLWIWLAPLALLAVAGCGGEGGVDWPADDPRPGALRGELTAYVDDEVDPRVAAFHLYWRGEVDKEDDLPFAAVTEGSWPEPTIYEVAFEIRPPPGTVALEVEVLLDWPDSPVLSARLPLDFEKDLSTIDSLELVVWLAMDDLAGESPELTLSADLYRLGHPDVALYPSQVPSAGSDQEAIVTLVNALRRPIWSEMNGLLFSRQADGALSPARRGIVCGGHILAGSLPIAPLLPGGQRELGEPFYIGGTNALAPGEHVYRTTYRLEHAPRVCERAVCVRKNELFELSLPISIE